MLTELQIKRNFKVSDGTEGHSISKSTYISTDQYCLESPMTPISALFDQP